MDSGRQSIRFSLTYNSGGILSGPLDRLLLSFSIAFKTSGLNETLQRGSKFTLASEQAGSVPLSIVPTLAKWLLSKEAFCKSLKHNCPVGAFNGPMLDLRFKRLLT